MAKCKSCDKDAQNGSAYCASCAETHDNSVKHCIKLVGTCCLAIGAIIIGAVKLFSKAEEVQEG